MKDFLKSWGLLLAALLVGALAFFAATSYLSDAEENLKRSLAGSGGELVDVVVANSDLPAGTTVSAENLAVAQVSALNLSAAVITPDMFEGIDGSLLKFPMSSGEPLLTHFLEGVLIERFSELLEDGQRAVTLEVDNLTSNAGLLSVGDHVDIFLSGEFAESDDGNEEVLVPLFQNIRVLAVDRNPLLTKEQPYRGQDYLDEENLFDYGSVTLALQADDADNLAFAASRGEIVFLLRGANDKQMRNWSVVDTASVIESGSSAPKRSYAFFGRSNRDASGIKPEIRTIASVATKPASGRKYAKSVRVNSASANDQLRESDQKVPAVEETNTQNETTSPQTSDTEVSDAAASVSEHDISDGESEAVNDEEQ
jgi:pilus assembly protein CpaB